MRGFLSCRTLPYSEPPIPGESLVGLVARAAARHGVDRVAPVLRVAGIHTLVPEAVATTHRHKAAEIAAVLMTDPSEVERRTYPPVALPDRPDSFIDFFGTPIREAYRESVRRRVSPASLARSAHHRALWDLRTFNFCPESRETLLSACPACGKALGWRWTLGGAFCEACGEDLRAWPQPLVDVPDDAALDFVVDLVHPDPDRRARALAAVPSAFEENNSGELFEFAVALACAATSGPDSPRGIMRRVKTLADFSRLTPAVLARAGRIVLDWPKAFHVLADEVRGASAARPGRYGLRKEMGPLAYLGMDGYLPRAIKDLVKAEVAVSMRRAVGTLRRKETRFDDAMIPLTTASERYGIGARVLARVGVRTDVEVMRSASGRSPILIGRGLVEALARDRDDAVTAPQARKRLGVDATGPGKLADAGLIRRLTGPVESVVGPRSYSRSSVEAFRASVLATVVPGLAPRNAVRLSKAVKRAAVADVPWESIFRAILDGRIRVYLHPSEDNSALTTSVALAQADDLAPSLDCRPAAASLADPLGRVNTHEAAALLGSSEAFLAAAVRVGLLATNGCKAWKLDRATVLAFKASYVLTAEVAHRLGCRYRDVRTRMARFGVAPAHEIASDKHLIWNREKVERAIEAATRDVPQPNS